MEKKELFVLGLIVVLALIVRIPGVFWGYHVFGDENVGFNVAESPVAINANRFLNMNFEEDFYMDYAFGFPFHVAIVAFPLKFFIDLSLPILVGIGRLLSVFYGLLTIILVYFLSKYLLKNKKIGIIAALFLALSGSHIIFSHFAKSDVDCIFWMYATFFFSFLFIKKEKNIFLLLTAFSAGAAAAVKFVAITIIPLIYITVILLKRKKLFEILLIILVLAGSFAINSGFMYTPKTFTESVDTMYSQGINFRDYNKLWNPIVHIVNLLTGLGLPILFFLIYGFITFLKKMDKNIFFIIILPLILFFIQICLLDYAPVKYSLPIIPLLTIIAAFGFIKFIRRFDNRKIINMLFLFILVYQMFYIYSIEYNYVNDPRGIIGEWILKNINRDELIYIGEPSKYVSRSNITIEKISKDRGVNKQGMIIPSEFQTTGLENAKYLVIPDDGKYTPSYINPFKEPKCCNEIMGCIYDECIFIQKLLKNEQPYHLINKVKIRVLTPELKLYNHYFKSFVAGASDVLLYQKIKIN